MFDRMFGNRICERTCELNCLIFYKETQRIKLLSALRLFLSNWFAQINDQVAKFNPWPPYPTDSPQCSEFISVSLFNASLVFSKPAVFVFRGNSVAINIHFIGMGNNYGL